NCRDRRGPAKAGLHVPEPVTIEPMRFADLVATSDDVARTSGRLEKIDRLASLLERAAAPADNVGEIIEIAVAFLSGAPRQGRLGVGGAALRAARQATAVANSTLDLAEVHETFGAIRSALGP